MAPKQPSKGQKFTLADFANMVEREAPSTSCWADEEMMELPTAPTGATGRPLSGGMPQQGLSAGEYRPGRGPSDRRNPMALPDLDKIPSSGPFVLYLANLPYSVTESLLRSEVFGSGYHVSEVRIPHDPEGKPKGFAYVTVGSGEEMRRALREVHGRELAGRQVRLDVAEASGAPRGDWRSSGSGPSVFAGRPGRDAPGRMDDRPGRRAERPALPSESSEWRSNRPSPAPSSASSSFTHSSGSNTVSGGWRSDSSQSGPSAVFGSRPSSDAPSSYGSAQPQSRDPRNQAPRKRSEDIVIRREDFGRKLSNSEN